MSSSKDNVASADASDLTAEQLCNELGVVWQAIVSRNTDIFSETASLPQGLMKTLIGIAENVADRAAAARQRKLTGPKAAPLPFPPPVESQVQQDTNRVFKTLMPPDTDVAAGIASRTSFGMKYTALSDAIDNHFYDDDKAMLEALDNVPDIDKAKLDAMDDVPNFASSPPTSPAAPVQRPLPSTTAANKDAERFQIVSFLTPPTGTRIAESAEGKLYGIPPPEADRRAKFFAFLQGIEQDETWDLHWHELSSITYAEHIDILEMAYKMYKDLKSEQGQVKASRFKKRFIMYDIFVSSKQFRQNFASCRALAYTWALYSSVLIAQDPMSMLLKHLNIATVSSHNQAIIFDKIPHRLVCHYVKRELEGLVRSLCFFNVATLWAEEVNPYPNVSPQEAVDRLQRRLAQDSPYDLEVDEHLRACIAADFSRLEKMLSSKRTPFLTLEDLRAFFRCLIACMVLLGRTTHALPKDAQKERIFYFASIMTIAADIIHALTNCWVWQIMRSSSLFRWLMDEALRSWAPTEYSSLEADSKLFACYPISDQKPTSKTSPVSRNFAPSQSPEFLSNDSDFDEWLSSLSLPLLGIRLFFHNPDPEVSIATYALSLPHKIAVPNAGKILYEAAGGDSLAFERLKSMSDAVLAKESLFGAENFKSIADVLSKNPAASPAALPDLLCCSATVSGQAHAETCLLGILGVINSHWLCDPADHVNYDVDADLRARLLDADLTSFSVTRSLCPLCFVIFIITSRHLNRQIPRLRYHTNLCPIKIPSFLPKSVLLELRQVLHKFFQVCLSRAQAEETPRTMHKQNRSIDD